MPPAGTTGHATSDDPQYVAGPAKQGILRWDVEVPKSVDEGSEAGYRFQLEFDKRRAIAAGMEWGMAAK